MRNTITDDLLKSIEELAEMGSSKTNVCKILGLSHTTISRNNKVRDAFHKGQHTARLKLLKSYADLLETDRDVILKAVQRLNIVDDPYNTPRLETIEDAKKLLSASLQKYTRNEITLSQHKTVESGCKSFVGIVEVMELEKRIEELEKLADEKTDESKT